MTSHPVAVDGRTARAARTHDAVVDALLALIGEGNLRPTARQVSERAGVSLRSVFQHFDDLESLFAAAAHRQISRVMAIEVRVTETGPLPDRVGAFTDSRSRLLEAITPVRRAALLQEPFSAEIANRLSWARQWNLDELQRVFAPELAAFNEADRQEVVAALHAATEWYSWETLRAHNGLSAEMASRVMSRTIRALLQKEE
jgi:AcrR family transcriptional regulator